MPQNIGKKDRISIALSPYYAEKIDAMVDSKKFSSRSELVAIAVQQFVERYDREEWERTIGSKEHLVATVFEKFLEEFAKDPEAFKKNYKTVVHH